MVRKLNIGVLCGLVLGGFTAVIAEGPAQPFDGKTLTGWKYKNHGPSHKPLWAVGSASLHDQDPRIFKVEAGHELINHVTGHGQGVDIYSEGLFGDAVIELEVMVPKGSNSGIYVMGEYEIQVLDSFGKDKNPGPGDMGAIYGAAPPRNPSYRKPGEWSTFEIHWQAPKFNEKGEKTVNGKFVKVVLNGKIIHENVEMKGPTPGGIDGKEKPSGPIMFQGDHGPVSYRNIRISPLQVASAPWVGPHEWASVCENDASASDPVVVLFDGTDTSHWQHDKGGAIKWAVKEGVMTLVPGTGSIVTKEHFHDFKLHLEFNIAPAPKNPLNSQLNGNSGVYIQKRYEIQILDSYGEEPAENGCGSIYKQRKPDVNACRKAGEWQTYEITFHAPKWEGDKKAKNARITVVLNGRTIHDDVEITAKTGAGQPEGPAPGPILLQDHGNVVSFRNITIRPLVE